MEVKARARLALNDIVGAEQGFRCAIATAQTLGIVPAQIIATSELARLLNQSQRKAEAVALLSSILKNIDSQLAPPFVNRAIQLLAELDKAE